VFVWTSFATSTTKEVTCGCVVSTMVAFVLLFGLPPTSHLDLNLEDLGRPFLLTTLGLRIELFSVFGRGELGVGTTSDTTLCADFLIS